MSSQTGRTCHRILRRPHTAELPEPHSLDFTRCAAWVEACQGGGVRVDLRLRRAACLLTLKGALLVDS